MIVLMIVTIISLSFIDMFHRYVPGENIGFQQAGCERRGIAGIAAEKGVVQRQVGQVRGRQRGEEEDGLAGEGEREDVQGDGS